MKKEDVMERKNISQNKSALVYLIVIVLSIVFIISGYLICKPEAKSGSTEVKIYPAKVVDVYNKIESSYSLEGEGNQVKQELVLFVAQFIGDYKKGEKVEAVQKIDQLYYYQPQEVKNGDKVLLSFSSETDEGEWTYIEHNRIAPLIALVLFFLLLILIIGRKKGFNTIVSLIFTVAAIFVVYIPSILKGYNIYLSTIIISVFIILMSLIIINGINKKTLCAVLGNIGGIVIAGLFAIIMNKILHITGLMDDDFVLLKLLNEKNPIDLKAIIWGSIVIGSLGAIMDVAMSIASAMNELSDTMKNKSFSRLLKSGMNIGKDAIGTMTNTLILAYIGGALATVLLIVANNKNILYLFNLEVIMVELVQAIVGSIGILVAVPVTALLSAKIYNISKSSIKVE